MARNSFAFTKDVYFEHGDKEYTASVYFSGYDDPGRCSGPPESCYPPEGEFNYEVTEIFLYGEEGIVKGCDGEPLTISKTDPLYTALEELAEEAAQKEIENGLDVADYDEEG